MLALLEGGLSPDRRAHGRPRHQRLQLLDGVDAHALDAEAVVLERQVVRVVAERLLDLLWAWGTMGVRDGPSLSSCSPMTAKP